ncbi:MAG TPA: N-acetylglucosamine-6-phosphate deacetylase [Rhizomicrobium sp.]|nr:N-acetylglucosamine-6-phosphate deacetylase [Rhizomicrobium sp.]
MWQNKRAIFAERLFDGRGWRDDTAVLVEDGRILAVVRRKDVPAACEQDRLPEGAFLAPGFIDLQVNGGGGVLLNDDPSADAMRAIARAHRPFGTTALLPTLITDTRETMKTAIAAAREASARDGVLGLHLEGPFLNSARAGVHRKDVIAQAEMGDLEWMGRLADLPHAVITLAPECVPPGFIGALCAKGIRVSAGHSEASAEIMLRAMQEGLTGITHLFNAMPPLSGRAPGIIGTALSEKPLIAGIIVDGLHVDPVSIRAAFAAKGADGIALVTDAMPSVGADVREFDLLGTTIFLREGRLVTDAGTLAGAHLDMASAVRNAVQLAGIALQDALISASRTPARFLGIEDRGAIAPGARADLVALTDDLMPAAVWLGGVPA